MIPAVTAGSAARRLPGLDRVAVADRCVPAARMVTKPLIRSGSAGRWPPPVFGACPAGQLRSRLCPALTFPRCVMRIRTVQRQQAPPPLRHRGRAAARIALRLLIGAAAIWALLSVIGLILTHVFGTGPVHSADLGVDRWFLHRRSAPWNSVMLFGTDLARTETVIGVAVAAAVFFRWRLKRWRESLIVVAVVAGEVLIFLAVTLTVPQRRPPVPKLQAVPPTSSYPSGHTAAAVALYGCIAVLILANWAARHPSVRVAAALLFCIPLRRGFPAV